MRCPMRKSAHLEISGPGYFSVLISAKTRGEADRIGAVSTIGFIMSVCCSRTGARRCCCWPRCRSPAAALAGVAALAWIFGSAHGITLAFGFTLLGVAQEYPIRLLSHRRAGEDAVTSVRAFWPLLATAIVSAAIAYLAFFASGVSGLEQLAVFTISGLLVAGSSTR